MTAPVMAKYDHEWVGLDVGREGLWADDVWLPALRIFSRHEGEPVYEPDSPIYDDLETALPGNAWRSWERDGNFRPLFRDYPGAWTKTGLLDLTNQQFHVTPRGRELLAGRLSSAEVIRAALEAHEEEGERPFAVLAAAFAQAAGPINVRDAYFGVMRNYRPGDSLDESLALGDEKKERSSANRARRLKSMLAAMERAGAILRTEDGWIANDTNLLRRLASEPYPEPHFETYRRADETRRAAPREPFPVDPEAVDRALQVHAALQNSFADWLSDHDLEPRSPRTGDPDFDLAWTHDERLVVGEVKSLPARELHQLRLALGQVLDYRQQLRELYGAVDAVIHRRTKTKRRALDRSLWERRSSARVARGGRLLSRALGSLRWFSRPAPKVCSLMQLSIVEEMFLPDNLDDLRKLWDWNPKHVPSQRGSD